MARFAPSVRPWSVEGAGEPDGAGVPSPNADGAREDRADLRVVRCGVLAPENMSAPRVRPAEPGDEWSEGRSGLSLLTSSRSLRTRTGPTRLIPSHA